MISIIINVAFLVKDHESEYVDDETLFINYNFRRVSQNITYSLNIYVYIVK